jgi:hypothetical protein
MFENNISCLNRSWMDEKVMGTYQKMPRSI